VRAQAHPFACRAYADTRQVRYDMRGHERSDKPGELDMYTSAKYAEDYVAVARAFALRRPVLAGWSLGAVVAADVFAARVDAAHVPAGLVYFGAVPALGATVPRVATARVMALVPGLTTTDGVPAACTGRARRR
jgi:pimeloyl-ACP methyl ester carboxylesterase